MVESLNFISRKFGKYFIISTIVFSLLIAGCEKEDDKESPPEIPPATTFVIDFSDFPSPKSATLPYLERGLKDIQTTQNWAFAATNVFVWSAIITLHLVIPVSAFVESFNHEPEYQGDLH